jgi:hypothetical protein
MPRIVKRSTGYLSLVPSKPAPELLLLALVRQSSELLGNFGRSVPGLSTRAVFAIRQYSAAFARSSATDRLLIGGSKSRLPRGTRVSQKGMRLFASRGTSPGVTPESREGHQRVLLAQIERADLPHPGHLPQNGSGQPGAIQRVGSAADRRRSPPASCEWSSPSTSRN